MKVSAHSVPFPYTYIPSVGQQRICNASVLIIGAGGLGCPASQYLAGVGIGRIGIIDHDTVEIHNLHRQVLHSEHSVGIPKALSAAHALLERNSNIEIIPYVLPFDSTTAMDIAKHYDIVLDCTDNVVTRYLINDVCVLLNKPLVSASALRFEGQITLYHHKVKDNEYGPCYRCLFKDPPPMEAQGNCSDEGVVGVGRFNLRESLILIHSNGNTRHHSSHGDHQAAPGVPRYIGWKDDIFRCS